MKKHFIYWGSLLALFAVGIAVRVNHLLPIQGTYNFLLSLLFFHHGVGHFFGYPERVRQPLDALPPHQLKAFRRSIAPCDGVAGLVFLIASFLPEPTSIYLLLGLMIPLLVVMFFIHRHYTNLAKQHLNSLYHIDEKE